MITYYVMLFFEGILVIVAQPITVLPDVALPLNITDALSTVGHWFGLVWGVIPLTLTSLFAAIAVIIVVENQIAIYKAVRWVYSKIPGVN